MTQCGYSAAPKPRKKLKKLECNGKLCLYSNERQVLILRKLTFDSIMSFYDKHNRSVYRRIVEAQRNGTLSPFVGAGLSVPFGYRQWGGVLTELAENIIDDSRKALALTQIKEGNYEEAAGIILEEYPFMLDQFPDLVSPDILASCPDEKKRTSAAWVLPYLFRRELVMTTNFDRVLEECYLSCQNTAIPTVTPVNRDRLAQLQLNQELCLLKLHGDIGREAVSIDDLVFTKEQYEAHYAEGSTLVSVLTRRFTNRRMLFLGCSLSSDRTMRVLGQVVKDQKGIRHFAILGCKKSEISTRMKELQALGILPIFYDDSNHDAVRVILERLLEETDSSGYKRLCRSRRSVVPAAEEKRPLMFDSEYFPFSGRETELARLAEFCEAEDQLLWWAVTGPGGMGKSRLVFEFCKSMRKQGWLIQRFEASPSRGSEARRLEELPGWTPEAGRTIVVLDDVQAYMESVCAWMTRVDCTPRSEDLRILLLEREGETLQDSSWLGPDFKSSHLDEWCHSESFLHLEPMTDEQLMSVMTDYAKAAGQTLNAELLLKTLERVDPQFKRPLYAVAIADARCQGKDPTNWDRSKILDTLLDRELKFHLDRLQGIDGKKPGKALCTELERLLAEACIRGFLPLEQVELKKETKPPYPYMQARMKAAELEPEDFCKRIGILRTAQLLRKKVDLDGNPVSESVLEAELKVIALACPDLLKEHLVLKLAFEKKTLELLPEGWHLDPNRLSFLRRLWLNYPDRLKDEAAFWDRFFSAPPASGLPAWIYADLLWGCTNVFPPLAQRAVDALDILYRSDSKDEQIAACYAKGLFNLVCVQSPVDRAATVNRLKELYDANSENAEVAISYAKGLVNLSNSQPPKDRATTMELLRELYDALSENAEVAGLYAMGLFNLSNSQSPEDRASTVEQLKELHDAHSKNAEVAVAYAKGLINLSSFQSLEECTATVERLRELYDAHSENAEVVGLYASGLYNLSCDQSPKDQAATVERLKDLYDAHSENADVIGLYAMGLGNLANSQPLVERTATVDRLEVLYNKHPGVQEIAQVYAGSLVNLAFSQTKEAAVRRTLARSQTILDQHSDDSKIQLSHAQTRFNLTLVQSEADIPATVSDIAAFLRDHPDAIPKFREALDKYLSKHPDHAARYQPLLELGGDGHA